MGEYRELERRAGMATPPDILEAHCALGFDLLSRRTTRDTSTTRLVDILATQRVAPVTPWDGTFGGPITGPYAWSGRWDPNSRSLVSLVLTAGLVTDAYPAVIVPHVIDALTYATRAEEDASRLPASYGNIVAAHAAACLAAGIIGNDSTLTRAGEQ